MSAETLFYFSLTVLPLVFTPGPDIMLLIAKALSRGRNAALLANLGILLGYCVQGVLAALGIAAVVAATPWLFETMRWLGVAYLSWLALSMLRSAMKPGPQFEAPHSNHGLVSQGFLTAFLNPKGLLMFFAILPQFMDAGGNVAIQALSLSAMFVFLCGTVYSCVLLLAARVAETGTFTATKRRAVDAAGGTLLGFAAIKLAVSAR